MAISRMAQVARTATAAQALAMLSLLALAGCGGTSESLEHGARALPEIATVDSGNVTLTDGLFDTNAQDLVVTDTSSGANFRLLADNRVTSDQSVFDLDGDGDLDYIVVTMRALSVAAQASTNAVNNGAQVPFANFNLVGGAALLPLDAEFSEGVTISVPVSSAAAGTLGLYQFVFTGQEDDLRTASGIESVSGQWRFLGTVTESGGLATFTVDGGGQFGVVASSITVPPATT
jgi:hypothetical protein